MSPWVPLLAMTVALLIDRLWGEPPTWAHPVVAMGRYLAWLGPRLSAWRPGFAFLGGAVAWCVGGGMVMMLAWGAQRGLSECAWYVQTLLLGVLLKPLLAWRMLRDEVASVEGALGESLGAGRAQLQRLVSRDVSQLDEVAVRESAIESLAENLNDSLVAPLLWFAVGGLGAAALYRFANTADAMWGYRGRYEWAGKWAARADDILSWLPARITALLLCLSAGAMPTWSSITRQARATPSPNGGWPMGVMALLLKVRLGKPGVYVLNESAQLPEARHTAQALAWAQRAVWWAAVLSVLLMLLSACWAQGGHG
ncbi:adenosylcobinamide-phosphate synthase CbiB [Aquabacterium sp.]|uniref:adenosylcobinamide-phosphate synthase CbiB n=1 Tax=Aquabacterium sp. TaxID=1872578 RepID=UPI002486D76F|nr:adenosylcobinamide-phosphate synthase CbiB [Aquabacterium sp.]MDI1258365.1 adenosylcobinamide-phosphate synthase CbiB [Aquabacterium sp.]